MSASLEASDKPSELAVSAVQDSDGFAVVGIGASAGSLEALERIFAHMLLDSGMAFVVIQHLWLDFRSVMDELLARQTSIRISRVESCGIVAAVRTSRSSRVRGINKPVAEFP